MNSCVREVNSCVRGVNSCVRGLNSCVRGLNSCCRSPAASLRATIVTSVRYFCGSHSGGGSVGGVLLVWLTAGWVLLMCRLHPGGGSAGGGCS
eukprot:4484647-Pyramimonas_sp.AAC.1